MKKVLGIVLTLSALFVLAACSGGSDSAIVGNWKPAGMVMGDEVLDITGLTALLDEEDLAEFNSISLSVKSNGTFTMKYEGEEASGKWTEDGDNYSFDVDGSAMGVYMQDDYLVFEYMGIAFKK